MSPPAILLACPCSCRAALSRERAGHGHHLRLGQRLVQPCSQRHLCGMLWTQCTSRPLTRMPQVGREGCQLLFRLPRQTHQQQMGKGLQPSSTRLNPHMALQLSSHHIWGLRRFSSRNQDMAPSSRRRQAHLSSRHQQGRSGQQWHHLGLQTCHSRQCQPSDMYQTPLMQIDSRSQLSGRFQLHRHNRLLLCSQPKTAGSPLAARGSQVPNPRPQVQVQRAVCAQLPILAVSKLHQPCRQPWMQL